MAALEILVVNHAVANLIREGKTIQIPSIMQASKGAGHGRCSTTSWRSSSDAKKIDMDEALAASVDKDDLVRRYRSGVTLAAVAGDASRFRVIAVQEASPASEAGLERGDLLLELDQKPCGEMTLEELSGHLQDGRPAPPGGGARWQEGQADLRDEAVGPFVSRLPIRPSSPSGGEGRFAIGGEV